MGMRNHRKVVKWVVDHHIRAKGLVPFHVKATRLEGWRDSFITKSLWMREGGREGERERRSRKKEDNKGHVCVSYYHIRK